MRSIDQQIGDDLYNEDRVFKTALMLYLDKNPNIGLGQIEKMNDSIAEAKMFLEAFNKALKEKD